MTKSTKCVEHILLNVTNEVAKLCKVKGMYNLNEIATKFT